MSLAVPLLQPLAALLLWSGVIMLWMYFTRFPAMRAKGIDIRNRRGSRGGDLDGVLPPEVQWKAHNYNHLMEQPTLYYAVVLALVLAGETGWFACTLAWAYVGARVLHSLEQVTRNRIAVRFPLFALGSICLLGLIVKLVLALFLPTAI
ncbi:MAPEG family protein [Sphingomicrobium astaxanthinifaciens]|uniref:MAPEG family protein n=1 Tax=Sphingomicrobium astaxanthinifaciens TaxID=1227949 RepID=UPI001FCAF39E|nr:MAPEG family protein [Sphingomicrobium astaxanthinifaciens]MCJ7422357.1 MAPEG family protein [Sphingomicrobium astaxanthinifaciens]